MIMPPLIPPPPNGILDPPLPLKVRIDQTRTYLSVFNNDVSEVVSAKNVPYVFLSKPGCSSIARPVHGSRRRPAVPLGGRVVCGWQFGRLTDTDNDHG